MSGQKLHKASNIVKIAVGPEVRDVAPGAILAHFGLIRSEIELIVRSEMERV